MSQENVLKLISGAKMVARESSRCISDKAGKVIDDKILMGKYVTREEYDQLRAIVEKLYKEVAELKGKG